MRELKRILIALIIFVCLIAINILYYSSDKPVEEYQLPKFEKVSEQDIITNDEQPKFDTSPSKGDDSSIYDTIDEYDDFQEDYGDYVDYE
jgi:hypothetical protein